MRSARQYALFFFLVAAVVAGAVWLGRRGSSADVLTAVPADAWLVATIDVGGPARFPPRPGPSSAAATEARRPAAPPPSSPGWAPSPTRAASIPSRASTRSSSALPRAASAATSGSPSPATSPATSSRGAPTSVIRARGGSPEPTTRGALHRCSRTPADAAPHALRLPRGRSLPRRPGRLARRDDRRRRGQGAARSAPSTRRCGQALAPKAGEAPRGGRRDRPAPVGACATSSAGELGAELGGEGERAYASVLAVALGGPGPRHGRSTGSTTELAAELRCESADACGEVKKLLERKATGLLPRPRPAPHRPRPAARLPRRRPSRAPASRPQRTRPRTTWPARSGGPSTTAPRGGLPAANSAGSAPAVVSDAAERRRATRIDTPSIEVL